MKDSDTKVEPYVDPYTRIERLAINRANQIIENWWFVDLGEFQFDHDLTDEEMDQVNKVRFCVALLKDQK